MADPTGGDTSAYGGEVARGLLLLIKDTSNIPRSVLYHMKSREYGNSNRSYLAAYWQHVDALPAYVDQLADQLNQLVNLRSKGSA